MSPIALLLGLAPLIPQEPEALGEYLQGLYADSRSGGRLLRLRWEDVPGQVGKARGALFPGSAAPMAIRAEIAGRGVKIFQVTQEGPARPLAEGTIVSERATGERRGRLELGLLHFAPFRAAPTVDIRPRVARPDDDDRAVREAATRALLGVEASESMSRALKAPLSPEARSRLNDILRPPVVLLQVSRDTRAEFTLGESVRVRVRHPILVGAVPPLRSAVLALKRAALARAETQFRGFVEAADDDLSVPGLLEYEEDWSVTRASGSFLSLSASVSCNSGGAHPNYWFESETLFLEGDGVRSVRLADLFLPCSYWESRMSERVLNGLRLRQASAVIDGTVKDLGEDALSPWSLTPTGISFFFAPYAVGCFAEGAFIVEVPFSEVRDILSTEARAAGLSDPSD